MEVEDYEKAVDKTKSFVRELLDDDLKVSDFGVLEDAILDALHSVIQERGLASL